MNKKIIIASGGSGGHIFPALVLGERLDLEGAKVLFAGDKKLKEYIDLGDNRNFSYKNIRSGFSLREAKTYFNIAFGFLKSVYVIFKFKPNLVIGFGSYASLPMMMAAALLGKKIFLQEQNSHVGRINKFFSSRAKYIFTSFYEIYGISIKNSAKIEFVGNLVRKEIKELYAVDYKYPKNGESFNILITCGSGGASFFTEKFMNIFKYFPLELRKRLRVAHQTKTPEEVIFAEKFYRELSVECEVKTFFTNLPEKIKKAHLVVSRSGIGTISELAVAGKPAIFAPSPLTVNNHQFFNAEFFQKNNACVMLEEKNFNERRFAKIVLDLINSREKLENLSKNIRNFSNLNAEDKILNFIREDFS
ncbi:MAG: UDP-N-acetylglucosamine--N-acetylmuramyl-(pentapeptide) pyrophosphoryl-undecaprenol N-acetylglucosamine transferase [Rickettsiales bacterium]|jgi:UDP-N-acetylglucosamine--N-acetylmuramyl-(pentapeptide) pyrophosphoryl-undecaprenol N-acetylglucosamine transferase|nr:UDP-N-acetylglucosamine--N-acetylmuramyl-(pentapeptide) pyrophosphoryl-undecaprenol N-acetylglucosamine transferase [Rickettsiales bacterium]